MCSSSVWLCVHRDRTDSKERGSLVWPSRLSLCSLPLIQGWRETIFLYSLRFRWLHNVVVHRDNHKTTLTPTGFPSFADIQCWFPCWWIRRWVYTPPPPTTTTPHPRRDSSCHSLCLLSSLRLKRGRAGGGKLGAGGGGGHQDRSVEAKQA